MTTTSTGAPGAHPLALEHPPISPPGFASDSISAIPLSDTGLSPEALKSPHRGFCPDAWLASFKSVGGGYALANGHVHLFVATTGAPAREVRMAREMLARLPDWELRLVNEAVMRASLGEGRA